jgi:hypothetical protein
MMIKEEFQSVVIKEEANSDISEDSYNKLITYANSDVYVGNGFFTRLRESNSSEFKSSAQKILA